METNQNLPFENRLIQKYSDIIVNKYNLSNEQALKIAIDAMNAYESHGGTADDFDGMMEVINIVVGSWVVVNQKE